MPSSSSYGITNLQATLSPQRRQSVLSLLHCQRKAALHLWPVDRQSAILLYLVPSGKRPAVRPDDQLLSAGLTPIANTIAVSYPQ